MTPLIGITPDGSAPDGQSTEAEYRIRMNYATAVHAAGGCPVILPWLPQDTESMIDRCDGILISGGTPGVSTKAGRTAFERALIRGALARGCPILGICNGMQLLGLELGAHFITSLAAEVPGAIDHMPAPLPTDLAHDVNLTPGTRLHKLAGSASVKVNSLHRQGIAGEGNFTVAARASDGLIEGIEGPGWSIGLQWHPEYCLSALDRTIFSDFVAACRATR